MFSFLLCEGAGVTSSQELRHVALLQEQEDLVVEVERCISKRESISMKVKFDALFAPRVCVTVCIAGQDNAQEN